MRFRAAILCVMLGAALVAPGTVRAASSSDAPADIYSQMANEVAQKLLADPVLQSKTGLGRKARVVIGDISNDTTSYELRVEDIFNEIRNQLVSSGQVELYAPGQLDVDLIVSPQLTSRPKPDDRHRHCYILNLTLNTPSGQFVAALDSRRCE